MWATAPETNGVACDVSHPVSQALCKFPELRGLKPAELANALRTTPAQAQMGILIFAGNATGTRITFEGISADDAMSQAGRAAPRTSLRFSGDAGSIVDTVLTKAKPYAPIIVVLLVLAVIFGESLAGADKE